MKIILFILLFSCMVFNTYGQFREYTFGDVSREELLMKDCAFEPGVAAMIIAEKGGLVQNLVDPYTEESLKRRIKIFKKEGLSYGTFDIIFNSNITGVEMSRVAVYNLKDDHIVVTTLNKEHYHKTEIDKNMVKYSITMPEIKEGSVIDIFYKLTSYKSMEIKPWYFQSEIPCGWSEYETMIQKKSKFNFYYSSSLPFVVNTIEKPDPNTEKASGYIVNRFAVENAPSFHLSEPYLLRPEDQLSKIELVYLAFTQWGHSEEPLSWSDVRDRLLKYPNLGRVVHSGGFLKNPMKTLLTDCTDFSDSLKKVYEYIRSSVKSNGYISIYANDIQKTMEEKSGNSGEINLLLLAALSKAGFDCHPLILATSDASPASKSDPRRNGVDYLVAAVFRDTTVYLLDASKREIAFNSLPIKCLNGDGFLVSDHNHKEWIPLLRNERFESQTSLTYEWNPEKDITALVEKSSYSLLANRLRRLNLEDGEAEYIKSRQLDYPGLNISVPQYTGLTETEAPFVEKFSLKLKALDYNSTDGYFLPTLPIDALKENPFKGIKRDFTIDYQAPTIRNFDETIKIPSGFKMATIPESITVSKLNGDLLFGFSVKVSADGREIYVHSGIQIRKSSFSKDKYEEIRQFYAEIVKNQNTIIELKKE